MTTPHSYLFIGSKVVVQGADMVGVITRLTKNNVAWVKVKSRWGNHHHPATCKTFRFPTHRLAPLETLP